VTVTENATTSIFDEETLDPTDWTEFRAMAHAALDHCIDHLATIRKRYVWQPVPDATKAFFAGPLPDGPTPLDRLLQDCWKEIMPYATGNVHPRFFGWVHGAGTPVGVIAEMIAATMNANCGGRDHGAIYVERQVIDWCREIFALPETTSGVLTVGTSMASVIAIATAKHKHQHKQGGDASRLVGYCSSEVHVALKKAFRLLGLAEHQLRAIPSGADFTFPIGLLSDAVTADRAAGLEPFLLIGTAGTVNTGAFDDLESLATLAEREGLWFHVDGAFGAWARLADNPWRDRTRGIERADSLAFDFHKWMSVPYDAGCVLIRDGAAHRAAFSERPDYLSHGLALAGGDPWPADFGIDLSRSFRALKIWMTLRHHGIKQLGRMVTKNCLGAARLAALVETSDLYSLAAPVSLNICCLGLKARGTTAADDALVAAVVQSLQLDGIAAPSTTRIDGRLCIRVAILNHRTVADDLDLLLRAAEDRLRRLQTARRG
jgi:glutamate/tyrosine decarboxylase-like PLP-dependent enzyme